MGSGLGRLRYVEWHAKDLFSRLDKDCSGELTISEFTAFLFKDRSQDRSQQAKTSKSTVPLDEERKKQLEKTHIACAESSKLAVSPSSKKRLAPRHNTPQNCSIGKSLNTTWLLQNSWYENGAVTRPDYIGMVKAGVSQSSSELRHRGQHVLTVRSESSADLCSSPHGLKFFNEF